MKIVLIRHGMTAGNMEKRYIGVTDESLCNEGIRALSEKKYPRCELLVCSPMKRCTETAAVIYPGQQPIIADGLRECDFGEFEGKNYKELSGSAEYQSWIDSGGEAAFPHGEVPADFRRRSKEAFEQILYAHSGAESAAFVVHGGTVMSVLEKYAFPHKDYFDWQLPNGSGWVCEWNGNKLTVTERI
ncbi:MAG: histidine phosphatase family protein [Ruminococcus sp.]|nr:histidine phosphatase family protein [Ruminococcus sp.]